MRLTRFTVPQFPIGSTREEEGSHTVHSAPISYWKHKRRGRKSHGSQCPNFPLEAQEKRKEVTRFTVPQFPTGSTREEEGSHTVHSAPISHWKHKRRGRKSHGSQCPNFPLEAQEKRKEVTRFTVPQFPTGSTREEEGSHTVHSAPISYWKHKRRGRKSHGSQCPNFPLEAQEKRKEVTRFTVPQFPTGSTREEEGSHTVHSAPISHWKHKRRGRKSHGSQCPNFPLEAQEKRKEVTRFTVPQFPTGSTREEEGSHTVHSAPISHWKHKRRGRKSHGSQCPNFPLEAQEKRKEVTRFTVPQFPTGSTREEEGSHTVHSAPISHWKHKRRGRKSHGSQCPNFPLEAQEKRKEVTRFTVPQFPTGSTREEEGSHTVHSAPISHWKHKRRGRKSHGSQCPNFPLEAQEKRKEVTRFTVPQFPTGSTREEEGSHTVHSAPISHWKHKRRGRKSHGSQCPNFLLEAQEKRKEVTRFTVPQFPTGSTREEEGSHTVHSAPISYWKHKRRGRKSHGSQCPNFPLEAQEKRKEVTRFTVPQFPTGSTREEEGSHTVHSAPISHWKHKRRGRKSHGSQCPNFPLEAQEKRKEVTRFTVPQFPTGSTREEEGSHTVHSAPISHWKHKRRGRKSHGSQCPNFPLEAQEKRKEVTRFTVPQFPIGSTREEEGSHTVHSAPISHWKHKRRGRKSHGSQCPNFLLEAQEKRKEVTRFTVPQFPTGSTREEEGSHTVHSAPISHWKHKRRGRKSHGSQCPNFPLEAQEKRKEVTRFTVPQFPTGSTREEEGSHTVHSAPISHWKHKRRGRKSHGSQCPNFPLEAQEKRKEVTRFTVPQFPIGSTREEEGSHTVHSAPISHWKHKRRGRKSHEIEHNNQNRANKHLTYCMVLLMLKFKTSSLLTL
ncbi:uncharacterized protein [Palaemon carinicauda]|uniref:uncharacterized protein n=1 Tax=Palaemon carinicauda TaxID=392227 RepID=UPI0035B662FC